MARLTFKSNPNIVNPFSLTNFPNSTSFCELFPLPPSFRLSADIFLSSSVDISLPPSTWEHPSSSPALFMSPYTLPPCQHATLLVSRPVTFPHPPPLSLSLYILRRHSLFYCSSLSLSLPISIYSQSSLFSNRPLFFSLLLSLSSLIFREGKGPLSWRS